jgi:hypothetical protein
MNIKLPPIAPVPVEQRRASFLNDIDKKLFWLKSRWELHGKYRALANEYDDKRLRARTEKTKQQYGQKANELHIKADKFKEQAIKAYNELRDIITQLSYETETFPSDQH